MTPISQVWSPQSLDMVPRAVAQRLVDALYSQAATLVIGIAAMVMAGALAFVRTGVTWLLVWTGLSAVVGAARLLQHWSYHQRRTMGSSRLWARRFLIGSWVVGALWGGAAATAVVTMPDPFVLFLLLVVGTGYIVGGAVRSNAVPIVVVGQSALTLVPLLVACLATADLYMRCFAVFVALEFSGIVMITRFLSAMTMRMLIADEEKCQQLAQLTEAQFELRRLAGEQEARERALHRSEQLFRATFEQAAVGMSQIGLDGTWLRVNDKLCEITGYSRDELLARRSQDITHPEDFGIEVAHVRALLGGETTIYSSEKRYLRKDGDVIWVHVTASVLRDAEGGPDLIIAIIEDITARKRAESALRESETRLQLAREAASFGVSDWDLVTDTALWTEEKWRQLGREPQPGSLDRETWIASLHPEDRERVMGELAASFADPARSYETEYRVVWPDGTVRWQLVRGKVFRGARGEAKRLICLSIDVTERREMEMALRQKQRLEAIGQLTGGVAHDFNNLLSVILLSAETLVVQNGSAEQAGKEIVDAALLGGELTRRLLAFARQQPLEVETVSLNALLVDSSDLLRCALGESIRVDHDLTPELWPTKVDPSQVRDALLNLAINARDAMPGGGQLTIATVNAEVDEAAAKEFGISEGCYVELSVSDNGIGMAPDVLRRALEPFFTTKPPGVGTGLGLSTVYGFASQSGGTLAIRSTPGAGTTVRLLLPRAAVPASGPTQAAVSVPSSDGRGRILLVDDNAALRAVAARQLASLGYQVTQAESGPAALAVLRGGSRFDLLFTDEVMPQGMTGTQLAEAASVIQPNLKVLFTSGYQQPVSPNRAPTARHMLAKPFRLAILAAKVQEVMTV